MLPTIDFIWGKKILWKSMMPHNSLVTNILQNIPWFVTQRTWSCEMSMVSAVHFQTCYHKATRCTVHKHENPNTSSRTELLHQNCSAWKGKPPTWHHKTKRKTTHVAPQDHSPIINHIASPWPQNTAHFTHFTLMWWIYVIIEHTAHHPKNANIFWLEATLSKTYKEQRSIKLRLQYNGNKTIDKIFFKWCQFCSIFCSTNVTLIIN